MPVQRTDAGVAVAGTRSGGIAVVVSRQTRETKRGAVRGATAPRVMAVAALLVLMMPGSVFGQDSTLSLSQADRPESALARVWQTPLLPVHNAVTLPAVLARPTQPAPPRSGDSLLNGAVTGAVVGALALGGLVAVVCGVYEPAEICIPDTLRFAAIGAVIGAGAGLAVDAALTRDHGVRVSVGVRF